MTDRLSEAVKGFPALINAIQAGKCVVFVGSGLSVGASYKSWEQIIRSLVDHAKKLPHARTHGIESVEKENDFLALADMLLNSRSSIC